MACERKLTAGEEDFCMEKMPDGLYMPVSNLLSPATLPFHSFRKRNI